MWTVAVGEWIQLRAPEPFFPQALTLLSNARNITLLGSVDNGTSWVLVYANASIVARNPTQGQQMVSTAGTGPNTLGSFNATSWTAAAATFSSYRLVISAVDPALVFASLVPRGTAGVSAFSLRGFVPAPAPPPALSSLYQPGASNTVVDAAAAAADLLSVMDNSSALKPVELSVAVNAVGNISAIASANGNLTQAGGAQLVGALTTVINRVNITTNGTVPQTLLRQVASAAGSVANNLLAGLTYNGSGVATTMHVSSNLIQLSVSVGPPLGSITAPGSASAFAPLPTEALPRRGVLTTTFMSLAFSPYAPPSSSLATSGVTRLELGVSGAGPITVSNLSSPILFTMPTPPPGVNGTASHPVCSFWDPGTQAVVTQGCTSLPGARPPSHDVHFVANFSAANDTMLAWGWNVTGEMMNNCSQRVLDCGATPDMVLFYNPFDPIGSGSIACPAANSTAGQQVLRVFYGPDCLLWQPNNSYGCFWNAVLQQFQGARCFPAPVTSCMCRHLTDFVAVRAPQIAVCSASQMTSLSANDIFVKLRLLFSILAAMFTFTMMGSAVAWAADERHKRLVLRRIRTVELGFAETEDGAWTWRLHQNVLTGLVGATTGSGVEICSLLGFPFVRFRAAVPEEWFEGSVAEAIGRLEGLSVEAVESNRVKIGLQLLSSGASPKRGARETLSPRKGARPRRIPPTEFGPDSVDGTGTRRAALRNAIGSNPEARVRAASLKLAAAQAALEAEQEETQAETAGEGGGGSAAARIDVLTGTALMHALLSIERLLPGPELARLLRDARVHFGTRAREFDTLMGKFQVMLSEGTLSGGSGWLQRARLWRLVFLQALLAHPFTVCHSLCYFACLRGSRPALMDGREKSRLAT